MPPPTDDPPFIPRWSVDLTDDELAAIADDTEWWAPLHRRQAARELRRREAERGK